MNKLTEHGTFISNAVGMRILDWFTSGANDWCRSNELSRLHVVAVILANPAKPELVAVQTTAQATGDPMRDIDDYDTDFRRLVSDLWDACGGWDGGSSSGHMENLRFVYHVAMHALEVETDKARRELKAKLGRLEQEQAAIRAQLAEEAVKS